MQMRWDPLVEKKTDNRRKVWALFAVVALVALGLAALTARPEDRRKTIKYNVDVQVNYVDDINAPQQRAVEPSRE